MKFLQRLVLAGLLCAALPVAAIAALVQSVGSTSSALQTTITTGTLSSAPTSGEIIIVVITQGGNGNGTMTPPTGNGTWTQVSTLATSATNGFYCSVWEKVAGASETTTYTFTSNSSNWMASQTFVDSGRNTSSPVTFSTKTVGGAASASPLSLALTGGTSAAADDVIYVAATYYGNTNGVTFTPPGGYSSSLTTQYLTSGFTPAIVSAVAQNVSAGATGTLTGSDSWTGGGSRDFVGFVISLAASGGGSCTHNFWSSSGNSAVPNGSSGSYLSTSGAFATPNCSSGTYWLLTGATGST